jgi:hypothetical protein
MRTLPTAIALVLGIGAAPLAAPLAAQATRDQARLLLNVSAGYAWGHSLWTVSGQPIYDNATPSVRIDTLRIGRRIRPSLTLGFQGIYYRGDHLGITAEGNLLGIGFDASCVRTFATASVRNEAVCTSLDQTEVSSSAVGLSVGLIYRVASRETISPFGRVALGATIANQSSFKTVGTFPSAGSNGAAPGEPVELTIYPDEAATRVTPSGTIAAGFTAVLAPGYQLRYEVRDNIVGVRAVTGPTAVNGLPPTTEMRYKHLFGMTIGFDVVLERRRGRRY